ncbi:hypothetical protein B0T10DRAFT_508899 [Thelonectria olida]|uniref:Uncharacterized protein n=1 Tax=Thelonectria olida TaxID=1576542 RepID=A0A9P9ASJ3_9HYPO|nr:hypothetical protein B0T10DRAFT_508899 [Thelonectria olida]
MSWMDSWSRPGKSQATPAPFYLLPGGESTPYCHSCGRVISSRRSAAAATSKDPIKYCSNRCRTQKTRKLDRELERAFVMFLSGEQDKLAGETRVSDVRSSLKKKTKQKTAKGDGRILVACSKVEEYMFGPHEPLRDNESGASTDSASPLNTPADIESSPPDINLATDIQNSTYTDGDELARMAVRSGTRIRPPQSVSEVNGSVGGEKGRAERMQETVAMMEKREEGQKRARQREMTKCAARRGVVFGFMVEGGEEENRRLCEAVMGGKVVEPSFAKGDWAIRWRE